MTWGAAITADIRISISTVPNRRGAALRHSQYRRARGSVRVRRDYGAEGQNNQTGDHENPQRRYGHAPNEQGSRAAGRNIAESHDGSRQRRAAQYQSTAVPMTEVPKAWPNRGQRHSHQRIWTPPPQVSPCSAHSNLA